MKKIFTILGVTAIVTMANAQVVINEVYGGGGNAGSTYKNDFVELINRGTGTVTLNGAYLQYGSATGVFQGTGTTPLLQQLPDITLLPGQHYLIQQAAGAGGTTDLPTPDFVPPTNLQFNMSGTAGKIALTTNATVVTSATDPNVIDLVGFGATANIFEGSGPTPAPSNVNSVSRTNGIDTNNNAVDFTAGLPTPQNMSTMAVSDVNSAKINLVKNTNVTNSIIFGANATVQIVNVNGQVVRTAQVSDNTIMDVSSLAKGMYIVTADVNGQKVSQKIIKN